MGEWYNVKAFAAEPRSGLGLNELLGRCKRVTILPLSKPFWKCCDMILEQQRRSLLEIQRLRRKETITPESFPIEAVSMNYCRGKALLLVPAK